jgi:hypothetical protein
LKTPTYLLRLEIMAGNYDRVYIKERLRTIPQTSFLIHPAPTKLERRAYEIAPTKLERVYEYAKIADFVVNTLVTIATVGGGFAGIAALLLELTKTGRDGRREVTIKSNSKSIKIRGDMSGEEIVDVLRESAKVLSRQQAQEEISAERTLAKFLELSASAAQAKEAINAYEKLVRVFEKEPRPEKWQRRRCVFYKNKLAYLRRELSNLKRAEERLRSKIHAED